MSHAELGCAPLRVKACPRTTLSPGAQTGLPDEKRET